MTSVTRTRRSIPWLAILLTSIVIAVYQPSQYLFGSLHSLAASDIGQAPTYATRPLFVQIAFYGHIGFSGIALLVGGFQFSRTLRRRAPRVHRWIGRTYVGSVMLGGASSLVMSFFSSVAFLGFFAFSTLSVLWIWTTYRGYRSARERDFAAHQAWMIRSFALTYSAPMLRFWMLLLIAIQIPFGVAPDDIAANAYAPLPFLAWLPNIVIAEYVVYRRGLPGLRMVRSPARGTGLDAAPVGRGS